MLERLVHRLSKNRPKYSYWVSYVYATKHGSGVGAGMYTIDRHLNVDFDEEAFDELARFIRDKGSFDIVTITSVQFLRKVK